MSASPRLLSGRPRETPQYALSFRRFKVSSARRLCSCVKPVGLNVNPNEGHLKVNRIIGKAAALGVGIALVGCGPMDPNDAMGPELESLEQGLQVVTNSSFEAAPAGVYNYQNLSTGSTALTNWTIGGGIKVMNSSYKSAAQGTKSVDLNSSYGPGNISQMVPTVVGAGYTVRFAIANGATCGGQWRYGTVTYGPSSASLSNSNAGWTYRSYVFNATSTSSLIKFESTSSGGCGIAIDDVTVTGP